MAVEYETVEEKPESETDFEVLVDTLCGEIQAQLDGRAAQEEDWLRYLKLYNGKFDEPDLKRYPFEGASKIVVNIAGQYVDQLVARILQSQSGVEPYWISEQVSEKYAKYAKPLECYLDKARIHLWDQYKATKAMVQEGCKLGTGCMYLGFRDDPIMRYRPPTPKSGPGRPSKDSMGGFQEVNRRTGPCPTWLPRERFLIPAGYSDPQTAPWIAFESRYSMQELRRLAHDGQIDPEQLEYLEKCPDEESALQRQRREDAGISEEDAERRDEYRLYSLWTVYFQWDLDGDGYPEDNVLMLHVNSKCSLYKEPRPNPYVNFMRPILHWTYVEVEGQFDGKGVPELIEDYMRGISTQVRQRHDNAHLANVRGIIASTSSGLTEKSRWYPGKILLTTDVSQVKEFRLGEVYPSSYQNEQLLSSYAEKRIGLGDPNFGQVSSPMGRASATTMMAVMQEGTRRHDMNTSELRICLSQEAQMVIELWQRHGLPEPDQPGSPEQLLGDPEYAALVREVLSSDDDLILGAVQMKLNVATAALNQEIEKQSSIQLLGTVSGYIQSLMPALQQFLPMLMNPQTPQPVKDLMVHMVQATDTAMRNVFQSHKRYDFESILVGDILAGIAAGGPSPDQAVPGEAPNGGLPTAVGGGAPGTEGTNGSGAGYGAGNGGQPGMAPPFNLGVRP